MANERDARLVEFDERLDAALGELLLDVARLSVFLPDLPERERRLIENVTDMIHEWETSRPSATE